MHDRLLQHTVLWVVFAAIIVFIRFRRHELSTGLILAYLANLWLIHWPAALTYLFPWYQPPDYDAVVAGFEQSLLGVVGFGIGAVVVGPFVARALAPPRSEAAEARQRLPDARTPYIYLMIGIFSYVVLQPLIGGLPTISALASGTTQLILVGFTLLLWHAWYAKHKRRFAITLGAACLIPLITILRQGFLSYGAMALIVIIAFLAVFVRPRWALLLVLLVVAYTGFSFYVTYMRDRGDIRATVWGGQTTSDRVSSLGRSVSTIEWFNPQDPNHLLRVNGRLNQNYLVGEAVINLRRGSVDYARGQTVLEAFQSLVPRVIWPDKPVQAGSPGIVTRYTGISFAANTSVGIGQVMEFYINFGAIGVVIGFIIFGAILAIFDTWAAQRLWQGDWLQFAVWFLPGVAMMQAGGSLVEVASSAGAALLAVWIINRWVRRRGPPQHAPLTPVHS